MKKLMIIMLLCITFSLFADEISETLQEINSLKTELEQNEIIVEQKIADLKRTNPLYAEQGPFESDVEYLGRMSRAMPQIAQLRKQYLGDVWSKLSIFRGRLFETKNLTIALDSGKYDPNTEEWSVSVDHLDYQKEHFEISLNISKTDASALFRNKDKLNITGMLAIDVGDRIGLAKLLLFDPISKFKFEHEFQPSNTFSHNSKVNSVAFSPDGKFLATGILGNTTVFNLETGNKVKEFEHNRDVNSVSFSPDGKFLATGSDDNTARIFNVETGNKVKEFGHAGGVYSVAFSPDGKYLATGSWGNAARIFNVETGNKVKEFEHYSKLKMK